MVMAACRERSDSFIPAHTPEVKRVGPGVKEDSKETENFNLASPESPDNKSERHSNIVFAPVFSMEKLQGNSRFMYAKCYLFLSNSSTPERLPHLGGRGRNVHIARVQECGEISGKVP